MEDNNVLPWDEPESIVPIQPLPFEAVDIFKQVITPETIAASLLEKYSGPESFVVTKKYADDFKAACDILKSRAINGIDSKKQSISFNGKTVAEISLRKMPSAYLYDSGKRDALLAEIEAKKTELKELEKFLQTLKSEVLDPETGEIHKPAQMISAGETVAVKFV